MARLLEAEIDNFLDRDLHHRVEREMSDQELQIRKIETAVREKHSEAIEELEASFQEIVELLQDWEDEAEELWTQSQRNSKNNVQTCLTLRFRGPKSRARRTVLCCSTLSGTT